MQQPTITWVCQQCGTHCERPPTKGQRPKYCSPKCRHAHLKVCEGARCTKRIRPDRRWCSAACKPGEQTLVQCMWCHALHTGGKYCSTECRASMAREAARALRSELRQAVEDGDHEGVLAIIQTRVVITDSACWEWTGKIRNGYATVRLGRKQYSVHRLALEAKYRAKLGTQAGHHTCANTSCVNPDHLEPVTFAANTAEMLAREAYRARIAELESALASVAPNHEALQIIRCA